MRGWRAGAAGLSLDGAPDTGEALIQIYLGGYREGQLAAEAKQREQEEFDRDLAESMQKYSREMESEGVPQIVADVNRRIGLAEDARRRVLKPKESRKMPHYKNGDPAFVGDGVVGHGYNQKDQSKQPSVLVGRITSVTPDAQSCNCQVVAIEVDENRTPQEGDRPLYDIIGHWFETRNAQGEPVMVRVVHDYSDCGQFAAVDGKATRPTEHV